VIIDRIDEEFLLVALGPDGSWATGGKAIHYGLAGSWLAELLIEGRIRIEGRKVVDKTHGDAGEETLNWALAELRSDKRPRPVRRCLSSLSKGADQHVEAVLRRLEGRGHVQSITEVRGQGRVRVYRPNDAGSLDALREHLKKVMFGTRAPDEPSIALLAMIDGAGLTGHVFGRHLEQQGHLLIERLLRRDTRMHTVAAAVRSGQRGWLRR
jgi:DNA-binding PadR family transcriptional regulator